MTCPEFEERIARYVGGDLEASDESVVEQHLRVCSDCAELARELEEDRPRLASRPPEIAEVDFAAMRREIRREITRRRWEWKWIAAAAAILLAVGVATVPKRAPVERRVYHSLGSREVSTPRRETLLSHDRKGVVPFRSSKHQKHHSLAVVAHHPDPESPVEIRLATHDPNVTIILLHETREVLQ
jgi:predicted anti-sigma-YlaC factor YlaD